jgi:hypothetical protein
MFILIVLTDVSSNIIFILKLFTDVSRLNIFI